MAYSLSSLFHSNNIKFYSKEWFFFAQLTNFAPRTKFHLTMLAFNAITSSSSKTETNNHVLTCVNKG